MNQTTRSQQTSTAVFIAGALRAFIVVMATVLMNDLCLAQSNVYKPPQQPLPASPPTVQVPPPPIVRTPTQQPSTPTPSGQTPSGQTPSGKTPAPTSTPSTVQQIPAVAELDNSQPLILKAEAFAGQPYGVGKVTFRLGPNDKMLDRAGAILIDDAQQRILYPVITTSAFKAFLENFVGRRGSEPTDVHTVWFLFQGEAPLTISVFGSQQAAINVPIEFVRPRQFDRRIKQWWQAFNRVVDEQIKSGDYPPILHTYLKNLIGKRFGFAVDDQRPRKPDPLLQTFELMFDVESLRINTINDLMTRGVQVQLADGA